jgi:UDP-2,3-diacylglucosamine hydrolase
MQELSINLPAGKRLYFASDFHLGVPTHSKSLEREKKLVRWLQSIQSDAHAIFLLGDLFDFWFEYTHAVPKGFTRFLGKLAEVSDAGIEIHIFPGNHDLWMFDYLTTELNVKLYHHPVNLICGNQQLMIGHGDGLGPGDRTYKILKKIFVSRIAQKLFSWLHPDIGISLAKRWSRKSRISNMKEGEHFNGPEREFLLTWCKEMEHVRHHDYYLFGHRHLPLTLPVGNKSTYINLGEWVHFSPYAVYDGQILKLNSFEG